MIKKDLSETFGQFHVFQLYLIRCVYFLSPRSIFNLRSAFQHQHLAHRLGQHQATLVQRTKLFITPKSAQRGRLFQSGAARCWAPAPDTRQRQSSPRDGLIFSLRYNYFLTIQPIIIIKINGFCSKRKSLNDLWCVPSLRSFFSSF